MTTPSTSAPMPPYPAPAGLPPLIRHYIDGELAASLSGAAFPVSDPSANSAYAECAAGQADDVDRAVRAAKAAFDYGPWPRMAADERARVLHRIAGAIEHRDGRLAELESFDTGLPITQTRGASQRAAENFRFFASLIVAANDESFRVGDRQLNYVVRKPVGVAGLITPWNTPFMLETWKLAPALASGCTVVLKPAEWSPLSASLLPEIMAEAGLPPGVFNIVHGIGEEAGDALVRHPDVRLISFTGETTTGKTIAANAAATLKTVSMELGGKSPCIVFPDADLDAAIDAAVFQIFSLNGERCTAGSRMLVHRDVYERVVERVAERARNVRIGHPRDPGVELGALIHPEHLSRVLSYVEGGVAAGARLVAGGRRPESLTEGNFLQATVFADVKPEHQIFQEEIFGPVLCITPFDDDDEALRLANGTRYGLAAYVWTSDLDRAHRFAHEVESGMVWVNSQNVRDLRTPFGGIKESGLGREGGRYSLELYSETRVVHMALQTLPVPKFGRPRDDVPVPPLALCTAGAAAEDTGGIHLDEVRGHPLDPRLEPGIDERRALGLGIQMMRRPPYQHEPPLARFHIDLVYLHRNLVLGMGDPSTQVFVEEDGVPRPQDNRPLGGPVRDRQRRGPVPAVVDQTPEPSIGEQLEAFSLIQEVHHTPGTYCRPGRRRTARSTEVGLIIRHSSTP